MTRSQPGYIFRQRCKLFLVVLKRRRRFACRISSSFERIRMSGTRFLKLAGFPFQPVYSLHGIVVQTGFSVDIMSKLCDAFF